MARLVYALIGAGTWDVHRAGCADVARARTRLRYQHDPVEFDADTEQQAREQVCDDEIRDLGYDPDTDVTLYPCAVAALAEPPQVREVILTIGYTEVDRSGGYVPMMDGFRPGAAQHRRDVTVRTTLTPTPVEWAEAVFVATNAPSTARFADLEAAVFLALEGGERRRRSVSVGDTVTVDGVTVACTPAGWTTVEAGHDCVAVNDLEFVATYGAPGMGQSWRCRPCGRGWAKVGDRFHPPEDGAHILRPEDVI